MSELGPTARELLHAGRDAGEPDDAVLARGRASLLRRVGRVTAAAATAATVSGLSATAKAAPLPGGALPTVAAVAPLAPTVSLVALPLAVKVTALAVAVAVGVGGAAVATRHAQVSPSVVAGAPSQKPLRPLLSSEGAEASPHVAPAAAVASAASASEPMPEALPPATAPVAAVEAPSVATRRATPSPLVASRAPSTKTNLAADVASLRAAQAALVAGDPSAALDAARRVQPDGPLAEEREGVLVLAGCAMGAPDARNQAERFLSRRPQAPVALRIRAACIGEK